MANKVLYPEPPPGYCACGELLHYRTEDNERMMMKLVELQGELQPVTVLGKGTYLVPRHYIALHGIKAEELPELGFTEKPTS